jgi:hypothetical protein
MRAAILAMVLATAAGLAWIGFRWPPAWLLALALLLTYDRLSKNGRVFDPTSWVRGLRGERIVAKALATLPEDFRVIHDLPTSHGNVDHVVVGPTGVFAIETKHYGGRLYPQPGGRLFHRGRDASHILRQATSGAIDVRRRLERAGLFLWVEALVVSSRAIVVGGPLRFHKVTVLDVVELTRFITDRPRRLSREQVDRAAVAITTAHLTPVR